MSEQTNSPLANKIANVKENKAFKKERKKQQIIDSVVTDLKKNPARSKTDISCIVRCCSLIENLVKKKYKIDKFDIVIKVFTVLFGALTEVDTKQLAKSVESILDCKLIKKVGIPKEIYSYAKKVFINNFLFRDQQYNQ